MVLRFRCEVDGTVFDAEPQPYPNAKMQTRNLHSDGDTQIVCPRCKRAYQHHEQLQSWLPGRPLFLLSELEKVS